MNHRQRVREAVQEGAEHLVEETENMLTHTLKTSGKDLEQSIRARIGEMVNLVNESAKSQRDKFVGVNDDDLLTYVADRRNFNGVGAVLISLLILLILPGWLKWLAVATLIWAAVQFFFGYIWKSKVDIAEGFDGVVCQFGKPLQESSQRGRNWLFSIRRFIPFVVSMRDQVVDASNANFTGDYVTVGLGMQIVFRVTDPGKFVSNTTPSGAMKLLSLYASYISLRMITSIGDARVKFTGRDHLENVIKALNSYLSNLCGIEVIRVNMPRADNTVLEDLESIRTELKEIDSLQQTRTVRLEAAIKAVEQEVRKRRVTSRNEALNLQQEAIRLETHLGQTVNRERQEILMKARQTLDQKVSELRNKISGLKANVEKSKALNASLAGLQSSWKLRIAQLRQRAMLKLMPKTITILGVEGIGTGVGLATGPRLLQGLLTQKPELEAEN